MKLRITGEMEEDGLIHKTHTRCYYELRITLNLQHSNFWCFVLQVWVNFQIAIACCQG